MRRCGLCRALTYAVRVYPLDFSQTPVMLGKVILDNIKTKLQLNRHLQVRLALFEPLQNGVALKSTVRVLPHAFQPVARVGIDVLAIHLPAYGVVHVQDGIVGQVQIYARQTVRQTSDVDDTACEPHAAKGVADMCGVRGQTEPAHSHVWRESLVHSIRTEIVESPLVWPGQDGLHLGGVPFSQFLSRQTRDLAVCHAPQAILGNPGDHVPMGLVNEKVGVVVIVLFKWEVHL